MIIIVLKFAAMDADAGTAGGRAPDV